MKRLVPAVALSAMAVVGATWWLNVWHRASRTAALEAALTRSQGNQMEHFALRDTQSHQTRWEILADIAQVDPKADVTTIEGVHLTLFSAKHGTVRVTAHHGVVQNQSKDMKVCGDVHLVVGQEFALTTECLQWRAAAQMLETDTPVAVRMGNLQVEGQEFRGWVGEERFEVGRQVLARWSKP